MQTMVSDIELERDIESERQAMMSADNHADRLEHWENMKNLVAMRSDRQIEKMEIMKGLRSTVRPQQL